MSLFFFLGLKKKKAVFNCKELCSAEMVKLFIPLHVNTGVDAVSDFFGQGNISFWHKAEKKSTGGNFITERWIGSNFTSDMKFYLYNFFLFLFH